VRREAGFVVSRARYVQGTRQRMSAVIRDLSGMQGSCPGKADHVVRRIREQEQASRHAGYERIARLCQSMDDCLTGLDRGEQPRLEAVTATLVEVCQAISEHADGIAETIQHSGGTAALAK